MEDNHTNSMIEKIQFSVLAITGEANGFSAKNLESYNPFNPGWQSPRCCIYPQELVLQLFEPAKIKMVQILSHQYMIATKVEFFVSLNNTQEGYDELGYVFMSNNRSTNHKSRELKSVHVDVEALYLKLLIHKNHGIALNTYNQVGIIAFSVLGIPLSKLNSDNLGNPCSATILTNDSLIKSDFISPFDDLTYEMYLDPDVALIIRKLEEKKRKSVVDDQFDSAKELKKTISDLHKVGQKLAKYELDKQIAIDNEDFDLAKNMKMHIDEFRNRVYQQLQKYQLPDELLQMPTNEMHTPKRSISTRKSSESTSHSSQIVFRKLSKSSSPSDALNCLANSSFRVSPHDDVVIPTLTKTTRENSFVADSDIIEEPFYPDEPEPLSDDHQLEAKSAIDLFGLPLVTGAYSKTYIFREKALNDLGDLLSELSDTTTNIDVRNYLRIAVTLLEKGLKDNILAVYQSALTLLEKLLVIFIPKHKLGKVESSFVVSQTLPLLLQKTGDSATNRHRSASIDFITRMSEFPSVQSLHVVSQQLLSPIKRSTGNRLALSKVEMVKILLDHHGIEEPSFGVDPLMKFSQAALEHPCGSVREEAIKLVLNIYRQSGSVIKAYLPSDKNFIQKSPLYRKLFDEIQKLGVVSPHQKQKVYHKSKYQTRDSKKRKTEVEELQNQVNHLRSVTKFLQHNIDNEKTNKSRNKIVHPSSHSSHASCDSEYLAKKTCIFCGLKDENFTEDGLDLHYWRSCPMLCRCKLCKQVVEICYYTEHLLNECPEKADMHQCPRCLQAISKSKFEEHSKQGCTDFSKSNLTSCPLCQQGISSDDASWQIHLMGTSKAACAKNPRRLPAVKNMRKNIKLMMNPVSISTLST